jgi:membrane protein
MRHLAVWPGDGLRQRTPRFVRTFVAEVNQDRLLGLGAETAFFAVLSIFPGLLVAVSLLGLLDVLIGPDLARAAQDRVVDALQLVLTEEASDTVSSVESLFEESRGGLLTFATMGALVTLSGAFAVTINALNLAYDVEEQRTWLRRRALGLALAVGTLLLVVVTLAVLVVGPLLGQGQAIADLIGLGGAYVVAWDLLRLPVLGLTFVVWLTALFHVAPNRRTSWRGSIPGALFTAAVWLAASAGFRLYLAVVADGNPVLGAFGGGVIVMTWVYLLSIGLLLGGELNAVLADRRRSVEDEAADVPAGQLELFR